MANVPSAVVLDAKRKAKELENFDCSKRRKSKIVLCREDEVESTHSDVISALRLLNDFRDIPLESMTNEEKMNVVTQLLM
jgi:hypothetical protein